MKCLGLRLRTFIGVIGVLAAVVAPAAAGEQVYDANRDFDASLDPPGPGGTNPNGVWTYSFSRGLATTPQRLRRRFTVLDDPAPINCNAEAIWIRPEIDLGWTPSVGKSIYGPCMNGNVDFEMNELILHPIGNDVVGFNGYAHVVFTAPEDLTCSVTATFIGRQFGINVDVHVLLKGNPVFNSTITENGVVREYFNPAVSLDAGDKVSFAVGPNQEFVLHPGNTAVEAVLDCNPD